MPLNPKAQLFYDIGEFFAAGFFEEEKASNAKRFCRAYRRFYETCPLQDYIQGAPLYPHRKLEQPGLGVEVQYCRQYFYNRDILVKKSPEAARIFDAFDAEHGNFLAVEGVDTVRAEVAEFDAWNHSALNFKRINEEGLIGYEKRIKKMKDADLRDALLDVLDGIRTYHARVLDYLISVGAEARLIRALEKVPLFPAESAYEALVSANFMFSFDGCDNIGYVDGWLPRYWKGEDLEDVMHCMMKALMDSAGWSITLGPEYSGLTKQWLRASRGLARPMVELRTAENMPDDIWNLACETVLTGGGQPSFYNEKAIQTRLADRLPYAPPEDIHTFAGMGCTETSFSGMTYCGGIDINLNVLKIFEDCMRSLLSDCPTFDDFYRIFFERLTTVQDDFMAFVSRYYEKRAEISFAPIRTLFTDDCIEKEKGFFQGGARYCFALPSDSGIPNTVDSLLAIKKLIFEEKLYTPHAFIAALDAEDPLFLARLQKCPRYGVADPEADSLLHDLTSRFYTHYRQGSFTMGDGFMPTSHQFLRHIREGKIVGNTPDGRRNGQSVADSIAAVNGKAIKGPTAMLTSAAAYAQSEIYGIPVLNLSITGRYRPEILRSLIEGYFRLGGTQIQITCTDRDTLLDAQANPECHRDLIVRVGGYSEFFCNLDRPLQNAVIERTLFGE